MRMEKLITIVGKGGIEGSEMKSKSNIQIIQSVPRRDARPK